MNLDRHMGSAVQRELEEKIRAEREHKEEVYARLKRLRRYKRDKEIGSMKWFRAIHGCVKCY